MPSRNMLIIGFLLMYKCRLMISSTSIFHGIVTETSLHLFIPYIILLQMLYHQAIAVLLWNYQIYYCYVTLILVLSLIGALFWTRPRYCCVERCFNLTSKGGFILSAQTRNGYSTIPFRQRHLAFVLSIQTRNGYSVGTWTVHISLCLTTVHIRTAVDISAIVR